MSLEYYLKPLTDKEAEMITVIVWDNFQSHLDRFGFREKVFQDENGKYILKITKGRFMDFCEQFTNYHARLQAEKPYGGYLCLCEMCMTFTGFTRSYDRHYGIKWSGKQ